MLLLREQLRWLAAVCEQEGLGLCDGHLPFGKARGAKAPSGECDVLLDACCQASPSCVWITWFKMGFG